MILEKVWVLYNQNKQTDIKGIRPSSIYGPYDNFNEKKSHVIPALIKKAYNKKKVLEVWGNKKIIRDFVYVEDLVDAMLKFILKKKNILPINFSSGKAISIFRLAKKILEVSKSNKKIYFNHSERSSANYRVLDNKKINQIVKNLNRTKLEDVLKKTIEWYKKFNV